MVAMHLARPLFLHLS